MAENIYIVDDDSMVRRSTTFALRALGYEPRPFMSGEDFLDALSELVPGCVLMDLRMPGKDGLQTIGAMDKPYLAQFPVIIVTGHGDIGSAVAAMRLGAIDFLEKPYDEAALNAALANGFASLSEKVKSAKGRDDAKARVDALSAREREVLVSLVAGNPNKIIAQKLDLSVRTVEMHRARLMTRLGVRSVGEAIRLALASGAFAVDETPNRRTAEPGPASPPRQAIAKRAA